jgi:amidohydrolase
MEMIYNRQHFAKRLGIIFDYLHSHPEVSWKEIETTNYLYEILKSEGFQPQLFTESTGLYVDIGTGTPLVGLRADIDALWQEVDGKYQANHSCGHDGHMTVALGVCILLREQLQQGAVRVIFQPAEEKGLGALKVLEYGIIDPLKYLFSLHVRPIQELADGCHSPALYHGASRTFVGEIIGTEAHAARPHLGINTIEVGAAIVQALNAIKHDPTIPASVKLTRFQAGGDAANIIPGRAVFSIDVRAQTNTLMDEFSQQIEDRIYHVAESYNATITLQKSADIVAAVVNKDAQLLMEQAIIETVGTKHLAKPIITPGGEDFHFYAAQSPQLKTTMLGLGCGVSPGLHHPDMTFNKERLIEGVEILTKAALLALQQIDDEEAVTNVGVSVGKKA